MNRGAWQAAVHRVAESRTRVRTNTFTLSHTQVTWLLPIDSLIQIHQAGTQGTEHVSRPTPHPPVTGEGTRRRADCSLPGRSQCLNEVSQLLQAQN